ncbi:flagellar motor switch protein G, partial [Pseudomonas syringae pv. pisi str. 1704B]
MNERAMVAKLSKVEKAAVLLLSLGETDAAQVLRHMGPKEVQKVGVAMAQMRNVHREQVEEVMSEFVDIVGDQTSLGVGSDGYIRKMLTQALGTIPQGSTVHVPLGNLSYIDHSCLELLEEWGRSNAAHGTRLLIESRGLKRRLEGRIYTTTGIGS